MQPCRIVNLELPAATMILSPVITDSYLFCPILKLILRYYYSSFFNIRDKFKEKYLLLILNSWLKVFVFYLYHVISVYLFRKVNKIKKISKTMYIQFFDIFQVTWEPEIAVWLTTPLISICQHATKPHLNSSFLK